MIFYFNNYLLKERYIFFPLKIFFANPTATVFYPTVMVRKDSKKALFFTKHRCFLLAETTHRQPHKAGSLSERGNLHYV